MPLPPLDLDEAVTPARSAALWQRIATRTVERVPSRWPLVVFPAAAALLGASLAILLLLSPGATFFASGRRAASIREFVTVAGGRSTVILRDGTRIILGPETHLRVPQNFGQASRTVALDGEAYFAVVHDAEHPFAVQAHRATITDVGTEFVVRDYPADASVQVGVARGEVAISVNGQSSRGTDSERIGDPFLQAGDMAEITGERTSITRDANIAALAMWTQGGLAFEGTPLRQVVRDLDRSFGVTITIADSVLANKRVTATFPDAALDEVLDAITQILGARYEHSAHAIVIRPGATADIRRRQNEPRVPLVTATTGNS